MSDETKLKACPFCGGEVKIEPDMIGEYDGDAICHDDGSCVLCGFVADVRDIKFWNSRPLEDAKDAEIARLRAALLSVADVAESWHGRKEVPYWNLGDIASAALKQTVKP